MLTRDDEGWCLVTYFEVRNWRKFQHYNDRNPPWIKLHYDILSSKDWVMLADASKVCMIACMLIASRNDGKIPNDPEFISRVAYLKRVDLKPLIDIGFLCVASNCKQMLATARPETETETETETDQRQIPPIAPPGGRVRSTSRKNGSVLSARALARFEKWYAEYPRKEARGSAEKAWAKYDFDDDSVEDMIAVLKKQKRRWADPRFIPHPATYLNRRQWEDVPVKQLGEEYAGDGNDIPF